MERENPRHLLIDIVKILKRLKISYFITGGIAVVVWGRPRFTADIDIVVELSGKDIDKLEKALRELRQEGYIDKYAMEEALSRRGEFNFFDSRTGVKVDFWLAKDDPFDTSRMRRKRVREIFGEGVAFISPEDLILVKLQWYQQSGSTRQLEDIESIIEISRKSLDRKYLRRWAKHLGVLTVLDQALLL